MGEPNGTVSTEQALKVTLLIALHFQPLLRLFLEIKININFYYVFYYVFILYIYIYILISMTVGLVGCHRRVPPVR